MNLKKLNSFLTPPHFKLEDIRTVIKLLHPGVFFAKLDLKEAYYAVSVDKHYRKYFSYAFQDRFFQFTFLPFGLSTAPYVFTKLMKPAYLRNLGIFCVYYLDDWLIIADSKKACLNAVTLTISTLKNLGFTVNLKKSEWDPCQQIAYLGFVLDSNKITIELPDTKRQKIRSTLKTFCAQKQFSIKLLAEVIGLLVAACPADGWLYLKVLERERFLALQNNGGNYRKFIFIQNR